MRSITKTEPADAMRGLGAAAGPVHACAFFHDDEEHYRVLLPFVHGCTGCDGQCLLFVDPQHERDRAARLARSGVKIAAPAAPGCVELRTWEDVYLRGGRFDIDEMLELLRTTLREGRRFGGTHVWGDMEWTLRGLPGSERIAEYESRLNMVIDGNEDVVVCAYRPERYSASLIMDVLRTHPMVLVDGRLRANPLYVPPQEFLSDLQQRTAPRPGLRSAS